MARRDAPHQAWRSRRHATAAATLCHMQTLPPLVALVAHVALVAQPSQPLAPVRSAAGAHSVRHCGGEKRAVQAYQYG
jgi:hypothetical protein